MRPECNWCAHVQLCVSHRRQPTRLPRPWDSPGKNTGVGCHFLLQRVKVKSLSRVRLFATPWTLAHQVPPSMGFSRQEYWSGLPLPSPGDLPDPGIEPRSPTLRASELPGKNWDSGLQWLSPGDLPDPEIKPMSLTSPALAGGFLTTCSTWAAIYGVAQSRTRLKRLSSSSRNKFNKRIGH